MLPSLPVLALLLAPPAPLDDCRRFLDGANQELLDLSGLAERAAWVQNNFITDDTEVLSAHHAEKYRSQVARLAGASVCEGLTLPPDLARLRKLLRNALVLAAPADPRESAELARIATSMEGAYGRGKWCPETPTGEEGEDGCLDLTAISRLLRTKRDPKLLLDLWRGWHAVAPPLRQDFERFVTLANKGARELGFADTGAMWRAKYDMPPEQLTQEVDRLWEQVKPLYLSLHAYVRTRLRAKYGPDVVPERGPIPAHLLGNMWAQDWTYVKDLLEPPAGGAGLDVGAALKKKGVDEREMVRYAERFFTSLGFEALPKTFWERSLLVKPRDREVVCHASASDIDNVDDLRIKMCIEITDEDFDTIHHELGHNFYQRAYNTLPFLFRDGANEGFHEAIGDTVALSITPKYLVKVGLLDREPDASQDIDLLLRMALAKVAFLPFGLVIDQWRWKVFSGEISPADYNRAWWDLRLKYQGVAPPVARSEADFDPGAKYHVPANVSYTRYFLAHILQFQFHRSLTEAAGERGPLHRRSIYGSREAGRPFQTMLGMGASRPWPEALTVVTGGKEMDARAILDYFAPLKEWLDRENQGHPVGW